MDLVEVTLREAADPMTTGERLQAIWDASMAAPHDIGAKVRLALRSNPSLPHALLRMLLRDGCEITWHNAAVPLLLATDLATDYRALALRSIPGYAAPRGSLESCVRFWADRAFAISQRIAPEDYEVRGVLLARRMAELFALPWPEQAAAE